MLYGVKLYKTYVIMFIGYGIKNQIPEGVVMYE